MNKYRSLPWTVDSRTYFDSQLGENITHRRGHASCHEQYPLSIGIKNFKRKSSQ